MHMDMHSLASTARFISTNGDLKYIDKSLI